MNFPPNQFTFINPSESGITILHSKAKPLFDRARFLCGLCSIHARLLHRDRRLLTLETMAKTMPSNTVRNGAIQAIPINLIRGSVNRSDDFDRDFYPMNDRHSWRWIRIASMMLQGTPLPPVELAQVGQEYFVIDGHHRISVAKMLKYQAIDAVISAVYEAPEPQ
jgi:hypothetical protein